MQLNDLSKWQNGVAEVSGVLKSLGNERRLLILCQLAAHGEMSVGALVNAIGLSQSALSQHLARMRREGVVKSRRDGQTIFYSVGDGRVGELMQTLYSLYCADDI